MTGIARYLTHPQVAIDPAVPVDRWGLSDVGRRRVVALAGSPALAATRRVISSAELKAIETAEPIAAALGIKVEVREPMHENDRSATGYLPKAAFEAMADRFFAAPEDSAEGWERAVDAQARIVREVAACLAEPHAGDILFVGHGGVGTLLYCHLAGKPIDRAFDQPGGGGGCVFSFRIADRAVLSAWTPMEGLVGGGRGE